MKRKDNERSFAPHLPHCNDIGTWREVFLNTHFNIQLQLWIISTILRNLFTTLKLNNMYQISIIIQWVCGDLKKVLEKFMNFLGCKVLLWTSVWIYRLTHLSYRLFNFLQCTVCNFFMDNHKLQNRRNIKMITGVARLICPRTV